MLWVYIQCYYTNSPTVPAKVYWLSIAWGNNLNNLKVTATFKEQNNGCLQEISPSWNARKVKSGTSNNHDLETSSASSSSSGPLINSSSFIMIHQSGLPVFFIWTVCGNPQFTLNYLFVSEIHPVATSRLVTLRPSLIHIIPPSLPPEHRVSRGHQRHQNGLLHCQLVSLLTWGFHGFGFRRIRWREVDDWYPQGSKR